MIESGVSCSEGLHGFRGQSRVGPPDNLLRSYIVMHVPYITETRSNSFRTFRRYLTRSLINIYSNNCDWLYPPFALVLHCQSTHILCEFVVCYDLGREPKTVWSLLFNVCNWSIAFTTFYSNTETTINPIYLCSRNCLFLSPTLFSCVL